MIGSILENLFLVLNLSFNNNLFSIFRQTECNWDIQWDIKSIDMEYEVLITSMGTILSSISFGTMKSGNLGHQLNKLTFSCRW